MKLTNLKYLAGYSVAAGVLFSAGQASAQYQRFPYLEAECPFTSTGAYGTKYTSTASYSGQGYLKSQGNTTPADYNNTSADHATYTFRVHGGYHRIWFRVNTNGNAATDSFFLRVDGMSSWQTINNISGQGSGWRWVSAPFTFPWGPGEHTLEIANRESGIEIDKIAVLYDTDPAPTGTGQPAYNCAVPLYFEAECPKTAFGAYPFKRFTKAGYSGSGYLYSKADTTVGPAQSVDQAIYPFDSGTGTYSFYFRIDTNGSANDDSWFYRVDTGSWVTMNNVANATGWRWVQGTGSVNLTVGKHTLEIRNRENGLNIDKIAMLPGSSAAPTGSGAASVNCEPAVTTSDWDGFEASEYADTLVGYFGVSGAMVLDMHVAWHNRNDSGGTAGAGSGISFLGMHRSMMNDFRQYALSVGGRPYIPINTNAVFPVWQDAYRALEAAGSSYLSYYYPRNTDDLTGLYTPSYLTVSGGPALGSWGATFQLDGTGPVFAKLGDIPDLDTLGRVIGMSGFHGSAHGWFGGTMGSFQSPADPAFYAWHGLIDTIADNWLKTAKGQAWAAANPSHPFLNVGFTDMDGWDNADWQP